MLQSRADNDVMAWQARQAALADFGVHALRSSDLDAVLTEGVRLVARGLRVPIAKVLQIVMGRDELLLRAAVGLPPEIAVPGQTLVPSGHGSEAGYALLRNEPVISEVATETRFAPSDIVRQVGATISVNVLIRTSSGPFGTLEADATDNRALTAEDVDFVTTYATLLGAAVDRHASQARLQTLLEELRHRVKNDLQVVSSLVSLETRQAEEPAARESLEAVAARILSLRLLYEQLYATGSVGDVDLPLYLGRLAEERFRLHGIRSGDRIRLDLKLGAIAVERDQAIALGLIANEFMTNSLKHAFAPAQNGAISISLDRDERSRVRLTLADDGVGRGAAAAGGSGLELIGTLANQIRAKTEWLDAPGTRLVVSLPMT